MASRAQPWTPAGFSPPAMATTASAVSSGCVLGLGEIAFTSSLSLSPCALGSSNCGPKALFPAHRRPPRRRQWLRHCGRHCSARRLPLSLPLSNLSHPSLDQRPQMADTPSPWQNCLRVPRLYSFYTRSPRPDENPDFSDLFKFKNSSRYLQKCHYIVLLIKSSF